ncbi:MAG: FAD-binding oxidoreductase [Desulfobacteraceae bacterium]|nr:MAG: FAD-binding oxidoreductase [Desulfobacteraceae bacterium]
MKKTYDLIIIGSGSIGVPTAYSSAGEKQSVLVLDSLPSPGQGQDKKAIGGIRATHSDKGKILVSRRSIEIFSRWEEETGDDIRWKRNGYSFPAYTRKDERLLKALMIVQRDFGLNIRWVSPGEYREVNPGIEMEGLRGSTYSPEDGSASPLLFIHSCCQRALERGAVFRFHEPVIGFEIRHRRVTGVKTTKGLYRSARVLNAAGAYARGISQMAGIDIPVDPDCHEAGITEPIKSCMGPMVVDMRKAPGSKNFYFYQNTEGQVIFCLTPDPPVWGTDSRATAGFLPMAARRMIKIMPMLVNIKVRRTWRGLYPMSPDGFPLVGKAEELENFYQAVGMCGQGFMLGPGMGELITRMLTGKYLEEDHEVLKSFDPYRDFTCEEVCK